MNKSTLGGIGLAILGIALGLYLEGGKIAQLLQPTAALIVFGGTLGAVLVQFPFSAVMDAGRRLRAIFTADDDPTPHLIDQLRGFAARAMRSGIVSLDSELSAVDDPFLRKALMLAVDGANVNEVRQRMELEIELEAERDAMVARVFEAAGGFAPTIGILGAVIGLIQVMQRLQSMSEVGKGIAVAFVATIYGVGSANLFLLPCAGRVRILARRKQALRELMLEGVISIMQKVHPRSLETKLSAYLRKPSSKRRERLVAS